MLSQARGSKGKEAGRERPNGTGAWPQPTELSRGPIARWKGDRTVSAQWEKRRRVGGRSGRSTAPLEAEQGGCGASTGHRSLPGNGGPDDGRLTRVGRLSLVVVVLVLAVVAARGIGLVSEVDLPWVGQDRAMSAEGSQTAGTPIRIGVGPEPEARLLGWVLRELLTAADIRARVQQFVTSGDARQAIEFGEVDVLPSYTGAVWLDEFGWPDPPGDPLASYRRVRRADARRGLVWLPPTGANATFGFVVAEPPRGTGALDDLDQLALWVNARPEATLCVDPAFAQRPDGLSALARLYGMSRPVLTRQVRAVDARAAVTAVDRGHCVAGLTTTTDGQARAADLRPLADHERAFPAFLVAAVVTADVADTRPPVLDALEPFGPALTTERLAEWNARVVRGEPVEKVAGDAASTLRTLHRGGGSGRLSSWDGPETVRDGREPARWSG